MGWQGSRLKGLSVVAEDRPRTPLVNTPKNMALSEPRRRSATSSPGDRARSGSAAVRGLNRTRMQVKIRDEFRTNLERLLYDKPQAIRRRLVRVRQPKSTLRETQQGFASFFYHTINALIRTVQP
jgi:hypothetical protein